MKLQTIKTEWDKYLIIEDPWIVDVVLATLVGNALIPRDSIWMMVVAKSSGGKTTLIKPCDGVPGVFFLDDLTEKTFLSGFKGGKGKETSLLKTIGNGVLAFSDFTTILSKNPVSRGEILAQMRVIADGQMTKKTGNSEGVAWKGKIGFLGASTPSIYFHLEQGKAMGERFTYYWMNQPTDAQIADKQKEVKISASTLQEKMAPMYYDYGKGLREWVDKNGLPEFKMSDEQYNRLKQTSMFCVKAKATVHTNFKTGKVDKIPDQAGIGRDNSNFTALLHTLQLMDCYEHDDINYPLQDDRVRLVQKCAYSSIDRERRKILHILAHTDKLKLTASEIGAQEGLGLEKESVEMYLNPLNAVGLLRKHIENRSFKWSIKDKETVEFIKEISSYVIDDLPKSDDEVVLLDEEVDDVESSKDPLSMF